MAEPIIVVPIGRWHQCAHILNIREFRGHKSKIILTEDGWEMGEHVITHCPFCGKELPRPAYSMARMDASPW